MSQMVRLFAASAIGSHGLFSDVMLFATHECVLISHGEPYACLYFRSVRIIKILFSSLMCAGRIRMR